MYVKRLLSLVAVSTVMFSCNNAEEKGKFTLNAQVKNLADQKVYLEQIYFSQQDPQVLDTADVKAGKFSLSSIATEEGLYRIRFEKMNSGFVFINDQSSIDFDADINDVSLEGPSFKSPANTALKNLLINIEGQRKSLVATSTLIDSLKKITGADSALTAENTKLADINTSFNKFITKYIDTSTQPVVTMFALGYTQGVDPALLKPIIPNLIKRFPDHQGIAGIVTQYNQMLADMEKPKPETKGPVAVGSMAPDFTMNDTEGKPFTLSSLKGKYVLVDFWASWCGPCRGENPNIVAAYNKFKDKNFTILGVSLDEKKESWLKAIQDDKLAWKQVSDLQYWNNATVALYGYNGIPYNVLLDPQGKVIATDLREASLHTKLAEVLK
ncbi:MAG: AhpC/TSA family protein [Chitinophagaceae bacterium]|nr:MAG: AhpC/TSA family protein [Chitinophagaceae bacterium]